MPKGYETANGTFDPTVNTLFINKEMLQSQPEYEQMFYLFHELRHALQYLHPESFDGLIARSRLYAQLHRAISELPEIQKRRLILYYFQGLTYEQIAEMEGCTKRAVKFSVDIAVEKLKKFFKNF